MAVSFLRKGKDSAALAKKQEAEAEARKESQGKLFRFWLKPNEEARVTFVDADLSSDGYLCPDRFYEHNLFLNGEWNNFYICPEKTIPDSKDVCPICKSGDKPYLVALFTIIDHRSILSKDKTKTWKDTKKLFAAKTTTFDLLNKQAMKRGGLTGATYDITRGDQKTPSVGSNFEFVEKTDVEILKKRYMTDKMEGKSNLKIKVTYFTPAEYEKEFTFRTGEELSKLPALQGGVETEPETPQDAAKKADYANQL